MKEGIEPVSCPVDVFPVALDEAGYEMILLFNAFHTGWLLVASFG